jgi:hypothetical protein
VTTIVAISMSGTLTQFEFPVRLSLVDEAEFFVSDLQGIVEVHGGR